MGDEEKAKGQLIKELAELRGRCAELQATEIKHKQAEAALRQSEERYRHLYEYSPIGIGLASADGKVISCNKAMENITGYSVEELKKINVADTYKNPEERKALIEAVTRHGGVTNFPTVLKRKDGTPYNVLLTLSLFRDLGGDDLFQTICIDVTEHKRAEEALRESEEKYRTLVEYSLQGLNILQGFSPRIIFANSSMAEIYGYTVDEFLSLSPDETGALVHPEDREFVWERYRDRLSGKNVPPRYEFRVIRKDGTVRGVEVFSSLIEYRGEPAVQAVLVDITERKRSEQALLERERELEIKTINLEEVNTALRVLLKRREQDKMELEEKVLFNAKELVMPCVEKLKRSGLDERQKACVSILESNLKDIVSPFSRSFSSLYLRFTPAEMEVANLVRHGKTTKEIAEFLNVSTQTIDSHRKSIRRKMGLRNKRANLRTHLLSMKE